MDTSKFFTTSNGDLVRYSDGAVIRKNYDYTFGKIENGLQMRATIRAGGYAWPGGYPLYFVTSDCAALCFACAKREFYQIAYSLRYRIDDGWRVVGCNINYEDGDLYCDHCNKLIPSAYGNDESED